MRLEVGAEVRPAPRQIALLEELRERQQLGGPAVDRHVAMGDRALQGQEGGHPMHVHGMAQGLLHRLEPEVIVAMRHLRVAPRANHVDLRGHLVGRTQPGLAHRHQQGIGEMAHEHLGNAQTELLLRVPDPVIGSRFREMVPTSRGTGTLVADDRLEHRGGRIDGPGVGAGSARGHARRVAPDPPGYPPAPGTTPGAPDRPCPARAASLSPQGVQACAQHSHNGRTLTIRPSGGFRRPSGFRNPRA
jgi:hypothetical protein